MSLILKVETYLSNSLIIRLSLKNARRDAKIVYKCEGRDKKIKNFY